MLVTTGLTDDLLLPPATRLVHLGPHKTGTSTLQWALHNAREDLERQGVHYAGAGHQAYLPALGLIGHSGRKGTPTSKPVWWRKFVAEVASAGEMRVALSSESFANAQSSDIERLASDLGPERTHIVRMIRRYDKMLPSQWQQSVTWGRIKDLDPWLRSVMKNPEHAFWQRHRFDSLTRRWADVVGADHTSVVIVNEEDQGWLLRVFEQMLGLQTDTLEPDRRRANRSLTRGEAELLRQLNGILHRFDWVDLTHRHYIRAGVSSAVRETPADPLSGKVGIDPAIYDALATATMRDLKELGTLGVQVIGDPGWLTIDIPTPDNLPPSLGLQTAVTALGSVVKAASRKRFALNDEKPGALLDIAPIGRLPAGAEVLLDALEAEARQLGWDEATVNRYVHRGAVGGLRALHSAPEQMSVLGASEDDLDDGRLAPRLVAAAIAGVIAAADSRLDRPD